MTDAWYVRKGEIPPSEGTNFIPLAIRSLKNFLNLIKR